MTTKPRLSFWQIWNMCFGFMGIQFGFALQNSNVSRIFQTLGASVDDIPVLWIAAPLTGLLVQPIVGYYSGRTWPCSAGAGRTFSLARSVPRRRCSQDRRACRRLVKKPLSVSRPTRGSALSRSGANMSPECSMAPS
jgi:hypothetical protein